MTCRLQLTTPAAQFTNRERASLLQLRARYRRDRDLLSAREIAHLEFIRWLRQSRCETEASAGRTLQNLADPAISCKQEKGPCAA